LAVLACDRLKVIQRLSISKDGELDLVARYVEKRGLWLENLSEYCMGQRWQSCARNVDKTERYGDDGYGGLHWGAEFRHGRFVQVIFPTHDPVADQSSDKLS